MQKILVIIIVFSLMFYLYYKTKQIRSKLPMGKKYYSGKSRTALGAFVAFFGINSFIVNEHPVAYIVSGVFIVIGILSAITGFKIFRFYLPHAIKEFEKTNGK